LAALVISGSGRGAGKTAVGCALIAALKEFRWTAVKVSPHAHDAPLGLWEETDRGSEKDTGRYLKAGARRAFLMTTDAGWNGARLPVLDGVVREAMTAGAVLVESNRFAQSAWARSGVRLAVIGAPVEEWKASLRECVLEADALVLTGGMTRFDLPMEFRGRHLFTFPSGKWASPALVGFVRERLAKG
jgi:molybdopterin-guanine dinucleotide biosynthesis protein